jgi:hypothetical protein
MRPDLLLIDSFVFLSIDLKRPPRTVLRREMLSRLRTEFEKNLMVNSGVDSVRTRRAQKSHSVVVFARAISVRRAMLYARQRGLLIFRLVDRAAKHKRMKTQAAIRKRLRITEWPENLTKMKPMSLIC